MRLLSILAGKGLKSNTQDAIACEVLELGSHGNVADMLRQGFARHWCARTHHTSLNSWISHRDVKVVIQVH